MAKEGRPRKYLSALELQNKIDEYFSKLPEKKEVYLNAKTGIPFILQTPAYYGSLLLHCDMTYKTAEPYEDGDYDDDDNKYSQVLTRARMMCEQDLAEGGIKGIYNPKVTESALQRHHDFAINQKISSNNINTNINHNIDDSVSDEDFIKIFNENNNK